MSHFFQSMFQEVMQKKGQVTVQSSTASLREMNIRSPLEGTGFDCDTAIHTYQKSFHKEPNPVHFEYFFFCIVVS
jgi:hypothetical protein